MAGDALRVALLSTSLVWRERTASLLDGAPGIDCMGAAATMAELGRLRPTPDAVIVDLPGAESLATLTQSNAPATPLVILSDEPDGDLAERALLAGSVAILERNPTAAHLAAGLHAALSGLIVLGPAHASALVDSPANVNAPRSEEWIQPLTPRELQILRMLSDGLPNKSIAAELQISEHTAKFHVSQILAKLGAESRTEAVSIGIRHGLVMV